MYLIDTSVWIAYFKMQKTASVQFFNKILDQKWPYGLTSVIYQEILQGVSSENEFTQLAHYLETQVFYHPKDPILSFQTAAKRYFDCRKKGITIRSTIDCLIAQIAIEHELILVHDDRDYVLMNKLFPELKII